MCNYSFYEYVINKAKTVYGDEIDNVIHRLTYEIERVEYMGLTQEFLSAEKLVKSYRDNRRYFSVRGSIGSLCLAYVLGITDFDPSQYDISSEMAIGIDGNELPCFDIEHDGLGLFVVNENTKFAKYRGKLYSVDMNDEGMQYGNQKVWDFFSAGNYPSDIGLDGDDTSRMLILTRPQTIEALAKAFSIVLSAGLFDGNAEKLVKEGILRIQEIPSTRDDFIAFFIKHGIPFSVAHSITRFIRTGRSIPKQFSKYISDAHLPAWLIPLCEKILYLPTRATCIQLSILSYNIVLADIK